ncbi:hypothetical protein TNIN_103751 [Trichonephila inaurata madagascariensis]|uniref:Uncharacterized protein n=1 Tax=Trichonephila inaurata madagascariensis TaxID=2747483 RepID=A0A8X7CCF0_9ARAC|nr:hypothetical protein TNIN_103751 [Trichonephila inaurata madagascariensis]
MPSPFKCGSASCYFSQGCKEERKSEPQSFQKPCLMFCSYFHGSLWLEVTGSSSGTLREGHHLLRMCKHRSWDFRLGDWTWDLLTRNELAASGSILLANLFGFSLASSSYILIGSEDIGDIRSEGAALWWKIDE